MVDALSRYLEALISNMMAALWRLMEDIIKVNSVCQLNSLIVNLTISNDLVDKIKMAEEQMRSYNDFSVFLTLSRR